MQLTTFVAGALAATAGLAAAQCNGQPCDPKAHVKLYHGGGCTQFVQETFFFSSFSQPPDACRAVPSGFDVVSVNTTDVSPGYTGKRPSARLVPFSLMASASFLVVLLFASCSRFPAAARPPEPSRWGARADRGMSMHAVHYYTDAACSQGETDAPPNHCEQASTPFKSAKFFVLQK